ncbi:N-acetylmuramoyl-L-alanine amidase [Rubritalea squalenifaciens DSM 18772]|uniref:N-acetylmuramoyl-L-alanine amidase n=2 Tax=Rubritalea TaxID=361050 RepID=A0A1M6D4P4_9BACT|nr:N-acetylmuramoyl-L-alanine amidase [Rubritalea squalenifaciens]SHI68242.1 N-acetylmuramoyl-L-alanine amidase [Rubritalea squalenifaciens DSM 18772]
MPKRSLTPRPLLAILLSLLCTAGLSSAGAFSTVVIDAGHGGKDIGGSYGKVYEKHLALDTAKRVDYMLKRKGYRTRMTRDSDHFITLQKRASIGNSYRNSIFVSIHYNYTYKRHVKGIETFYYSSRSKALAQYIQNATLRKTGAVDRGVKFARYYVIRHAKNPAVLVEGGFVSNSSECRDCKRGNYRQDIAEGIVEGIVRYQSARRSGRVR